MRTTTDFARKPLREATKKERNTLWVRLLGGILALMIFGVIEVFSASRYQGIELTGNALYFGLIHSAFVIGSLIIIVVMQFFPLTLWKNTTWLTFVLLLGMLVSVFFFPEENGARRWIPLGATGFNIQPSEFAKILSIFLGAYIFTTVDWNVDKKYSDHLLRFGLVNLPIVLTLVLILFEPDLGNIIVIGVSYFALYLLTSSKWKKFDVYFLIVVGVLVALLAVWLEPYRLERITTHYTFVKTGEIEDEFGSGLQLRNILIGVGSGGWWGKGIGGSRLRYGYFVEVTAFTDSIAAVIFEELGFFLSALFVGVYLYLFTLMAQVAEAQKDQYARLVVWGIALWFIAQSLFHFGANVALMPVKGITLPFISYGGSSMLAFAIAMGVLLKIARNTGQEK